MHSQHNTQLPASLRLQHTLTVISSMYSPLCGPPYQTSFVSILVAVQLTFDDIQKFYFYNSIFSECTSLFKLYIKSANEEAIHVPPPFFIQYLVFSLRCGWPEHEYKICNYTTGGHLVCSSGIQIRVSNLCTKSASTEDQLVPGTMPTVQPKREYVSFTTIRKLCVQRTPWKALVEDAEDIGFEFLRGACVMLAPK